MSYARNTRRKRRHKNNKAAKRYAAQRNAKPKPKRRLWDREETE